MDDTPRQFIQELRSGIWKKRAGQIALAVILAEACLRFLNGLTWFLILPIIRTLLEGHTESVLFETRQPFPWQALFGTVLDFVVALIFVFYLNRWIRGKSSKTSKARQELGNRESSEPVQEATQAGEAPEVAYNTVGRLGPIDNKRTE